MGTKLNPGKFDCYANAEPEEPIFILLARDDLAPFIVQVWAHVRNGDYDKAMGALVAAERASFSKPSMDPEKFSEALGCAADMMAWKRLQ